MRQYRPNGRSRVCGVEFVAVGGHRNARFAENKIKTAGRTAVHAMNGPEGLHPGIFVVAFRRERTLERPVAGFAGGHEADVHVLMRRGANLFRVQSGIYLAEISQNLESHMVLPLHINVRREIRVRELWSAERNAASGERQQA